MATQKELYEKAKELGIAGRSGMNKAELEVAVSDALGAALSEAEPEAEPEEVMHATAEEEEHARQLAERRERQHLRRVEAAEAAFNRSVETAKAEGRL